MRSPLATLAILALAACHSDSAAPPVTPPRAAGWSLLANGPAASHEHHMDVSFISADTGWMVDIDGKLWRTFDGGAHWIMSNLSPTVLMRSVGFVSAAHGFVGNLNNFANPTPLNALFETLDSGVTLTNISARVTGPPPVGICGMWVLDDTTVFAAGRWNGPAIFLRTRDAGQTWTSVSLSPLATGIVDVYFTDAMHGLAVGGDGVGSTGAEQAASHTVVLSTADGGDTWQLRFRSNTPGTWAWKISFPSDSIGYVSEQGPNPVGVFLKTHDGGQTWTELPTGTPGGFSGIGFASDQVGWLGADTATYQTDDGGATWYEVRMTSADSGEDINRFRMLPDFVGYAVGDKVYKYDGTLSARARRVR